MAQGFFAQEGGPYSAFKFVPVCACLCLFVLVCAGLCCFFTTPWLKLCRPLFLQRTQKRATGFKSPPFSPKKTVSVLPDVEHIQLSNWDDPITDIIFGDFALREDRYDTTSNKPTHVRSKGRPYSLLNFVASAIFFSSFLISSQATTRLFKVCYTMGCSLWGVVWKVDRRD